MEPNYVYGDAEREIVKDISDMEIRLATEADLPTHGALGRHGAQRAAMSNLTRRHNITPIRGLP